MRIEQLIYITEIAKTGSIANTSERLFVSSPGISLAISSLEEELGVKIFERSRTGLEPTPTGKKLITRAQEILNHIEEFKNEAKSDSSELEGQLSISTVPGICRSIIPKTLAAINTKFPKVHLQIKETHLSQVRKDVLNGDADLGIIYSFPSSHEENQLLTATHIIDSTMMVCFRKGYPLADKDVLFMEDLYKHPIVATSNLNDTRKFHAYVFGEFNKINFLVQSQNYETKKHFLLQGLALGFESDLTTRFDPFFQREDIIVKPVIGKEPQFSYYCIKLKNQYFSAVGKEFLKELQAQANQFRE
ncbi:LysR family transcriptional regulator [Brevibacillus sp. 179-C9.3 HS]|uniref:LysR family transcriptional regulator n=1 Tax=unclassified Brevibacillus TaxID=2684853 RepID=UPI0039A27C9A